MKILFDRRKANHRAFDEIMLAKINFRNFHHFLEQEKIVLREGGFNTELIEEIIQKADQLIQNKRLRDTNGEILLREIDIVRDDACKLASRLKRAEKYEFSLKPVSNNHTIQQAKRAFYVIVGGAIIVLNALNASHRLSLAETAVSGALGSAFISQAIPTP